MRNMVKKKANDKARLAKLRLIQRDRISKIKLERGCMDCGYNLHAAALDFDHRNDKLFQISSAVSDGFYAWEEIVLEMLKCDVVCANCHRVRTVNRRAQQGKSPLPTDLSDK